ARRLGAHRARGARAARLRGERALRLSARLPGAVLREAALPLRPTRARRPAHILLAGPRRRRARHGAGAAVRGPRQSHGLGLQATNNVAHATTPVLVYPLLGETRSANFRQRTGNRRPTKSCRVSYSNRQASAHAVPRLMPASTSDR